MAKTNLSRQGVHNTRTYEGAPALPAGSPERQLRRAISSCLLWEDGFYEDGVQIAERVQTLARQCAPKFVAALAVEARTDMGLRHAPLWLLTSLLAADRPATPGLSDAIASTVRRADEPGEMISLFRKAYPELRKMLPAPLKRGLAKAMTQFDAYQLAKYNRKTEFSLTDVLRLTHPKPRDAEQAEIWRKLVIGKLEAPDTWEVELSAGKDKRETFERLIREGKLGYMALLRNLRKMAEVGVDAKLIQDAIVARKGARYTLPFRYTAAARAAPQFEPQLDQALLASLGEMEPLPGRTIVLVDVSASMNSRLSEKSDMTRALAAATLASIIPGDVRVFVFNTTMQEIPPRRGMAGVDLITQCIRGGTLLGAAVNRVNSLPHDRLIVITDEESSDVVPAPAASKAYMINVAQARHEVGHGKWTRISGFSESVIKFMADSEKLDAAT